MKTIALSADQRQFFSRVANAVFANPFSHERETLDCDISGLTPTTPRPVVIQRVMELVTGRIAELDRGGPVSIAQFSAENQQFMTYAFIFDIYHKFVDEFDALIARQSVAGDDPCPVPFAHEVLSQLAARGFDEPACLRYLSFFYQIRRAFHFIEHSMLGHSPCMKELRRMLWNTVFTYNIHWYETALWNRMEDFSTLLLGETGTGKGAAAAAIGRSGFIPFDNTRRKFSVSFTKSFVPINLSQYPESLIESELFGHKKGAFTGAVEAHDGVFTLCSPHGAIFLDEIGDVSIPVQIKLLQVLQDRTFSPVGSHQKLRFAGRIIAATHKPLDNLRRQGQFRNDFYYRLCSACVVVPPLRQRIHEHPQELDLLTAHVLERMTGTRSPELLDSVTTAIRKHLGEAYPWPGNVRELEQCVRHVLLTAEARADAQHEPACLAEQIASRVAEGSYDADTLLADYVKLLYQRHGTYQDVARITKLDRRTVKKHMG